MLNYTANARHEVYEVCTYIHLTCVLTTRIGQIILETTR
jgi:hypothetical protein